MREFKAKPKQINFRDLEGQNFHYLKVLGFAGVNKHRAAEWLCECKCGTVKVISSQTLIKGHTKSCGCYNLERLRQGTHGLSSTQEYTSYTLAKGRCENPNHHKYEKYGGRGIEFRFNSFEEFLDEVGNKPSPIHSIDRIDNNGHYEIGNVKWSTKSEQSRNTSITRFLTVNGVRKSLSDWSESEGIEAKLIHRRLSDLNWCEPCAVQIPKFGGHCTHN